MVSTELRELTLREKTLAADPDAVIVAWDDWAAYKREHHLRVVSANTGAIWRPGHHVNAQCACGQWHRVPETTIICGCGLPVEPIWHEGEWHAFSLPVLFVVENQQPEPEPVCYGCGKADYWINFAGQRVCQVCHAPAPGLATPVRSTS